MLQLMSLAAFFFFVCFYSTISQKESPHRNAWHHKLGQDDLFNRLANVHLDVSSFITN